jgi:hypothetical protein
MALKKTKSKKKPPNKILEHRISTPLAKVHMMGLISFIISIIGLFSSFLIPFFFQIVGLILGHISLSDFKKNEELYSGKGFIVAGLIINYIVIVIAILIVFILGAGIVAISNIGN